MTTENDFQAALDANPEDWQTRLVFADWLQERSSPRADGYRALGSLRIHPHFVGGPQRWAYLCGSIDLPGDRWMPHDWYWLIGVETRNREQIEDAAALAFAKLPPERRVELLAGTAATA